MALLLRVVALLMVGPATAAQMHSHSRQNPIRKVVSLLQMMSHKVEAEGVKAEELFDKFMCYCHDGGETLQKQISEANLKIPQLSSSISELSPRKTNLEAEIKEHKQDRADAKEAVNKATALRAKGAAAFAEESAELSSNIAALKQAIVALEKGTGGFLQARTVSVLQGLSEQIDMSQFDRDTLISFLSESNSQAPSAHDVSSSEILGILKQMQDEMEKDLADAQADEKSGIAEFEKLVEAKTREIGSLEKAIEGKLDRIGKLGVELAETENDLEDTQESLTEDTQFLGDLGKDCKLKQKDHEAYKHQQTLELGAIADTINLLNNDDATELFKKTLPSSAASFLQVQASAHDVRQDALQVLKTARRSAHGHRDNRIDLLEIAIRGNSAGFAKVIEMVDKLVSVLKREQADDDKKKAWCQKEFDTSEDEQKGLENDAQDITKTIADTQEAVNTLNADVEALVAGIKELDRSVDEATVQRKKEHADHLENMAADGAAQDLLEMAKNRLNKFYAPKLHKAAPKRDLTEEESIAVNMGGTLAPTAPPGGIAGTGIGAFAQYRKSGEKATGVIAMIDLLIRDLSKQITELKTAEKDAQKDYERFMADAAEKRALDSKTITNKEQAKAKLEGVQEGNHAELKDLNSQLGDTKKYIAAVHTECDWLLQNADLRTEARANEVDALKKAKNVLMGADYSE